MKSHTRYNHVLFWIIAAISISIVDGWKCQVYLYSCVDFGCFEYGPFDVGTWVYNTHFPNTGISSIQLSAAGNYCYGDFYRSTSCSSLHFNLPRQTVPPHGLVKQPKLYTTDDENNLFCFRIFAVDTPNPTPAPSDATLPPTSLSPTSTPSTSPISSCSDYNNETSGDGNHEIRQFDGKHVTNIDNYFMNGTFVLEFNSSQINYQRELIECLGSHCVIQCSQSASCLETQIQIDVQNKSTLLLCHDDYSCSGASIKTQSVSMANVSVVCIGKYSCINMDIQLANISSFNLYCLQYKSCQDVNISID
eukprot:245602_1